MKLKLIKIIASFLMLVLGSQSALADEVVLDFSEPDANVVFATPEATPTASSQEALPHSPKPVGENSTNLFSAPQNLSKTGISEQASLFQSRANPSPPDFVELKFEVEPAAPSPKVIPKPEKPSVKTDTKKQRFSTSAALLFANRKSPGSIAVGAAEGNLTPSGKATSLYSGHTDPGNHVVNRGFCSWNRAKNLTVQQADRRCLKALQRQSAKTEQSLFRVGIDPKIEYHALVNGTDLWNQSNSAGPRFARAYQKALKKGLTGKKALVNARVEAFRNPAGKLDASGLFGICVRESYYKNKLRGYRPYSESWRWSCIALDQGRRVGIVRKALKSNIGAIAQVESDTQVHRRTGAQETFFQSPIPTDAPVSDENQLDFTVPDTAKSTQSVPESRNKSEPGSPLPDPVGLDFEPITEQVSIVPTQPTIPELVTDDSPNLRKTPKIGDKVAGYRVTSHYGKRINPISGRSHFHGGVDLATPRNTNIYAIGKLGTKTTLKCWEDIKGGGLVATMTTPTFPSKKFDALHLAWCKAIANGPKIKVDAGSIVGGTGNTGHSTGPHLHFQVRDAETSKKISPSKRQISWVLTGKQPKLSVE
jgi:D-alanyl-D-alanine dipeptidase